MFFLILFSFISFAEIKLAIIDAHFCKLQHPKISLEYRDMTKQKSPLAKKCGHDRAFHGDKVLRELVSFYQGNDLLKIYLFKVFDERGLLNTEALKESLNQLKTIKPKLVIMAIGSKDFEHLPKSLDFLTFSALGAWGNGINEKEKLWPQMLEDKNLVLFAHIFPAQAGAKVAPNEEFVGHLDPTLLYPERTNFFVYSSKKELNLSGTSGAVARVSGYFLSQCKVISSTCLENLSVWTTLKKISTSKKYRVLKI